MHTKIKQTMPLRPFSKRMFLTEIIGISLQKNYADPYSLRTINET